jgi:hypothetical protein
VLPPTSVAVTEAMECVEAQYAPLYPTGKELVAFCITIIPMKRRDTAIRKFDPLSASQRRELVRSMLNILTDETGTVIWD